MTMHINGCHNRPPFIAHRIVQDGHYIDGYAAVPRMKIIENFSAGKDCEYTKSALGQADAGCTDCTWRMTNGA
jgi:hypothetical protein